MAAVQLAACSGSLLDSGEDEGPASVTPPALLSGSPSNLKLWLRADSITGVTDDAVISTWTDSSAAAVAASTRDADPKFKALGIGNRPSVTFFDNSGTVSSLSLPNGLVGGIFDFFVVLRSPNYDGNNGILEVGPVYCGFGPSDQAAMYCGGDDPATTPLTNNSAYVLEMAHENNVGINFYLNGQLDATSTAADNSFDETTPVKLGLDSLRGDISEVIIFNTILSSGDRATITNYLNAKYAVY